MPKTALPPTRQMLQKLKKYGLTQASITAMQLTPMNTAQCAQLIHAPVPGMKIPYFDIDSKITSAYNVRLLEDFPDPKKPGKFMRYKYPDKHTPAVYIPPLARINWRNLLQDPAVPITLTEGEFKAVVATQGGYPTLGLPGVWGFRQPRSKTIMLPLLEEIVWQGRLVYIVYDSDAAANPQVACARSELSRMLAQRGAVVKVIELPQEGDEKVGVDDFLNSPDGPTKYATLLETPITEESANHRQISEDWAYLQDPPSFINIHTGKTTNVGILKDTVFAGLMHTATLPDGRTRRISSFATWNVVGGPRVELAGVTFEPGQPPVTDDNKWNMFRGFDSVPAPGVCNPVEKAMNHAMPDKADQKDVLDWPAWIVQNPDKKQAKELLFYGSTQGTGKDLLAIALTAAIQPYSVVCTDSDFKGDFNSHYACALVVHWSEAGALRGPDKAWAETLRKHLVTSPELQYHEKGRPKIKVRNYINLISTSNEDVPFTLSESSRRTIAIHFDQPPLPEELAKSLATFIYGEKGCGELRGEGVAYIHHMLMTRDLSEYNPYAPARVTRHTLSLREDSRSSIEAFAILVKSGELRFRRAPHSRPYATVEELLMEHNMAGQTGATRGGMTRKLKAAGVKRACDEGQVVVGGERMRLWCIGDAAPDLSSAETGRRYTAGCSSPHAKGAKVVPLRLPIKPKKS